MPRPWVQRLALLAGSTVVSLLLAEAAFRNITRHQRKEQHNDDDWRRAVRHMNRTIYRRSSDPALIYEPAPGTAVEMPYGAAGFNRAGMRDDREHERAPDARVRVAMIGDSLVWSEGVSVDESLPQRLQRALGRSVEVLPFGVSGYDAAQDAAWYGHAVSAFRPDIVVLVYCINDAMIASGPFHAFATPEEARRKDEQDSWLDRVAPLRAETIESLAERDEANATLRLFARAEWRVREALFQRSDRYVDEYLATYADANRFGRVRDAFASLHAALVRDGASGHVFFSPVLRDWDRYHWLAIHARVLGAAREAGLSVHDPLASWRSRTSPGALRLPGDSIHYSASGNTEFAAAIADALRADVAAALPRAAARGLPSRP